MSLLRSQRVRETLGVFSRPPVLLLLIILLAFALRVARLDYFSLRGDESFTVLFVQKPLAQMWRETLTVEPNPPLLYFLLRGWIILGGAGEFATRFFSVFFGVLCVPLLYRLAREIFDLPSDVSSRASRISGAGRDDTAAALSSSSSGATNVGLVAAFLIAINPYQIWHSQDVRNYTLWPALSLLALVFFWKWYKREDVPRVGSGNPLWLTGRALPLLAFVLAELAALYAHYYEVFLLLTLNLFVFATLWRNWRKLIQWLAAQLALAVLYLPYPLLLSNRVSEYGEGSGRMGVALWDIARETFRAFTLGETLDPAWQEWLWIPFALVAIASLAYLLARDWKRGLFFLLYAGVPTLAVFALNTLRPLYLERYLNAIAPAYYLLLAYGIVRGAHAVQTRRALRDARRWLVTAGLAICGCVALLALLNYWTDPAYAKAPDWRGLTQIINTNAKPGDIIVQNFPETSLAYYDRSRLPLVVYPETYLPDLKTTQQLNAMNANYQRAWFIPAAEDYWDPFQFVEQWLDHHDDLRREWKVGEFRLRLYATPSQYLNTLRRTNITLGDLARLLGYRTERVNDALRVVLYLRALDKPARAYDILVQALDANGKLVSEERSAPVQGAYPTTLWRKNEIVVDHHVLPNAQQIRELRVLVCDGERCVGGESVLEP